jgi:hypothetical protein
LHFTAAIPYACGVTPEQRTQSLVPGDPLQLFCFLSVTDDMVHGRVPWFQDAYEFSAPEPSAQRTLSSSRLAETELDAGRGFP